VKEAEHTIKPVRGVCTVTGITDYIASALAAALVTAPFYGGKPWRLLTLRVRIFLIFHDPTLMFE
jgi:hypothetical protein